MLSLSLWHVSTYVHTSVRTSQLVRPAQLVTRRSHIVTATTCAYYPAPFCIEQVCPTVRPCLSNAGKWRYQGKQWLLRLQMKEPPALHCLRIATSLTLHVSSCTWCLACVASTGSMLKAPTNSITGMTEKVHTPSAPTLRLHIKLLSIRS